MNLRFKKWIVLIFLFQFIKALQCWQPCNIDKIPFFFKNFQFSTLEIEPWPVKSYFYLSNFTGYFYFHSHHCVCNSTCTCTLGKRKDKRERERALSFISTPNHRRDTTSTIRHGFISILFIHEKRKLKGSSSQSEMQQFLTTINSKTQFWFHKAILETIIILGTIFEDIGLVV